MCRIVTRVDVIRHGEPEGGNVLRGRTDHKLTPIGEGQFRTRLERNPAEWQRIVSSPLQRCAASARWLANEKQLPLVIDDSWVEIDYGEWENRPMAELMQDGESHIAQLWTDPMNFCAPAGEPVPELQARVIAAWEHTLQEYAGEHLLIVSHGGVMRVLAQHLLELAPQAMNRLGIPYAGFMRFTIEQYADGNRWVTLAGLDGEEI